MALENRKVIEFPKIAVATIAIAVVAAAMNGDHHIRTIATVLANVATVVVTVAMAAVKIAMATATVATAIAAVMMAVAPVVTVVATKMFQPKNQTTSRSLLLAQAL